MCKCLLLILCILFPPLAVLIHSGCDINFCINIFLTILGVIPGIFHAIYVCFYYKPQTVMVYNTQRSEM